MVDFRGLSCGGMSSEHYNSPEIIQVSLRSSPESALDVFRGVLQKPGQGLDCLDWSDSLQTALEMGEKARGGVMGATMSSGWPYR